MQEDSILGKKKSGTKAELELLMNLVRNLPPDRYAP